MHQTVRASQIRAQQTNVLCCLLLLTQTIKAIELRNKSACMWRRCLIRDDQPRPTEVGRCCRCVPSPGPRLMQGACFPGYPTGPPPHFLCCFCFLRSKRLFCELRELRGLLRVVGACGEGPALYRTSRLCPALRRCQGRALSVPKMCGNKFWQPKSLTQTNPQTSRRFICRMPYTLPIPFISDDFPDFPTNIITKLGNASVQPREFPKLS